MSMTYSEVEHRDRHRELLRRVQMESNAGAAESLRHLAAFVDPSAPVAGQRMPFDVDVRTHFADRLRALPNLTAKSPKMRFGDGPAIGYKPKDAFVLDFSGGTVLSSGLACLEGRVLLSDVQFAPDYRSGGAPFPLGELFRTGSYDPASGTAPIDVGEPDVLSADLVHLVLDGKGSRTNFGHFIHDLLFQLPVIDQLLAEFGSRLRLLIACRSDNLTGFPFPMQNYIMERLGLQDIVTHLNGRAVRIPHGFVSSRPMSLDALHGYSARYCKARVREALGLDRRVASGPIYYLSRKDGAVARQIGNQDDMEALLSSRAIRAIAGTGASPAETAELFGSAGGLIGLHGAGLMNLLFSDAAAPIIEIAHQPRIWNSIQMCASAWQHPYAMIPNLAGQPGTVDCALLSSALAAVV